MSDVPPRLLRETLRDQSAPESSSACLDAETVAAWFDGALSRRDRTTAEAHVSTCARCQAVLAATAKTAAPSSARKWWQAPTVRWLVPIAVTSAAALVLWVKTPDQRRSFEAARSEQPEAVAETPTAQTSTAAPATVAPPARQTAPPLPQTARRLDRRADSHDEKAPAAPEAPRRESANLKAPDSLLTVQAPNGAPSASERDAIANSRAEPAAPRSAAPPPISGLAETVVVPFRQVAKANESVVALDLVSPNRNSRWRILPGGGVERSTDGGATWQTQSTGASATLTAGAAPAPTICWLVGPAGIVVLSTDGRTWQRVTFPEAVDLVSIRASDGANATVTAADGRTFRTSDGGRTWRLP
jgi:hypothetical protein